MWSEACEMLARAERLHREFFQIHHSRGAPVWEPPVDMLETDDELLIFVALPGVDPARAEAVIENGDVLIGGVRTLPAELRDARIHRLELPHGRFERRIPLPPGRYDSVKRQAHDGCLLIRLRKVR
jgi:HSP20 family molecular chaperone IbpA